MTEINNNDLLNINGGGPISDFFSDVGSAAAKGVEGAINGLTSLAKTAYSAGKQLGSYIRNW